ncbi:Rpn family recombination-promoting nuclease/putative transposase [Carboxylicivirga sediminis]|uniref:Rpn family recombination-promoting nuclease/putative transposase n=1 Tax=Carboxylicivirga sediminis TaxID=2006564 RepID=A0A941F5D7_9BACT|nr:Rpn family recombination-promoting nuclease/putative transposase [Carboxylicivirga sediminis]MBR8536739.1 Rpn family recombination-promoting nuclease/putative transposase [Carboxylicivirga sediminis]
MKKNDNVQKNNNIHDNFFKSLFSVKENLADLLYGSLPKDVLQGLKIESLEYDPTEYVDQELAPYFKDISCNMLFGHTDIKVSLLYEHKSYPDKNIHLQLLRYILNVWENQVANKQKLTPVLTMVFYHGKRKWTDSGFVQVPEVLKRFVPLFDYALFDTKDIEDHAIIRHFKRPSVKVAVWFMKRSDNLIGFIQNNPDLARQMFRQLKEIDETIFQKIALYLYKVSDMESDKIDEIMETVSVQTKDAFAEARRELESSAVKRIAVNMINEGATDEYICKMTGLSSKQVEQLRTENSH